MNKIDILNKQRKFYLSGKTLDIKYRIKALKDLYNAINKYEEEIINCLYEDLGKSKTESYMCEIGLVKSEISYMIKHIKSFSKEKRVRTPLSQYVSRSFVKPSPYGNVLILSPWNYPFLLSIEPLVDALSAGNTVILKPSAYSPNTSSIIHKIIKEIYPEEYVAVILGGRKENAELLELNFDYIFFTGSKAVGKLVMEKASKHVTPITLELGGKSPCIIDKSANLDIAAKRICFGKFVNCGQTCVAPDYVFIHESIKEKFIDKLIKEIKKQYTDNSLNNLDYGKIINEKHFDRLVLLIDKEKVIYGGVYNKDTLKISPTIMDNVTFNDKVMEEEIFGPILPIISYKDINEVISYVNSNESPLACYIFASNKKIINLLKERISFGGGCINDTLIHLATSNMGFGGVKESGMGSYHGKKGFETFTHFKSIVDKKTFIDLPMRYQPYKKVYDKLIRLFLK